MSPNRPADDDDYADYEEGCYCHIRPPCGYCTRAWDCDCEGNYSDGHAVGCPDAVDYTHPEERAATGDEVPTEPRQLATLGGTGARMAKRPAGLLSGSLVRATQAIAGENAPSPGYTWAECLCHEIDPSDTPCVTCFARFKPEPWVEVGERVTLHVGALKLSVEVTAVTSTGCTADGYQWVFTLQAEPAARG